MDFHDINRLEGNLFKYFCYEGFYHPKRLYFPLKLGSKIKVRSILSKNQGGVAEFRRVEFRRVESRLVY